MKRRTRLFCLLLALVLTVSTLPLYALAETGDGENPPETPKPATGIATVSVIVGKKTLYTYTVEVGATSVTLSNKQYINHDGRYYAHSYNLVSSEKVGHVTIPAFDSSDAQVWQNRWGNTIKQVYVAHKHSYRPGYNRIYHWNICACGDTTNEIPHVDPATDLDKVCICGYKFSDNADLTTLWLTNMVLSPKFNKATTEYTGTIRTHLKVNSTKITAKSFDALASVELPENLEIHDGVNKFEITVTAEDKTAKKTYTVIAVKPVKVENTYITTDGTTVSTPLKATITKKAASAAPSEAVADKILELAAADKASAITFQMTFSKWSMLHGDLTLSAEFLKAIAEETEASLTLLTPYGTTLTIPHSEIAALTEGHESITLRVAKDNTFAILADGEEITAPETVTLTIPET